MKVFISSVIAGLEPHRDAAAAAAQALGHTVIRAEDFTASPETPQRACLAGVREADVVIVLAGARYGERQASGISPTHEEYREAQERGDVLIMVQEGVEPEPDQKDFLRELQDWTGGHYTELFSTPESLRDSATGALHRLELARATGPVDPAEILARARALVPQERGAPEARLAVAVAGGPAQTILRPSELESEDLARDLKREALFGSHPVFDTECGTRSRIEGHRLLLEQNRGLLIVDEQGTILVATPIERFDQDMMMAIIEEDLLQQLSTATRFADTVLEKIDPIHRITHVVPIASLMGGSYLGWQTREERTRTPDRVTVSMKEEEGPVNLEPPHRPRAALRANTAEIVDDLMVLLRRSRT